MDFIYYVFPQSREFAEELLGSNASCAGISAAERVLEDITESEDTRLYGYGYYDTTLVLCLWKNTPVIKEKLLAYQPCAEVFSFLDDLKRKYPKLVFERVAP